MRRFIFLIPLVTVLLLSSGGAQTPSNESDDIKAIQSIANLYISARPGNLEQAFLASSNLYTTDEKGGLRVIPFAEYLERVKKNSNSKEVRQSTIETVEHSGDAALVKVVTTTPEVKVTDFLSLLRLEGHWKIVSKTFFVDRHPYAALASPSLGSPAGSACAAGEHHVFDFMIGDWRTSDSPEGGAAPAHGESTVEAMLDGCIVHEHRRLMREEKVLFDGDAYWGYDVTTKHQLLLYIDNASHIQVYEGREADGHLAFYRERPDPDGKSVLIRITYKSAKEGYTQEVERSLDHGSTWKKGGVTAYLPKR